MADDLIPDDVKEFILENIDSVAQLEGLLLLRGNPEASWSVEEIARRLYIDQKQITEILKHFKHPLRARPRRVDCAHAYE